MLNRFLEDIYTCVQRYGIVHRAVRTLTVVALSAVVLENCAQHITVANSDIRPCLYPLGEANAPGRSRESRLRPFTGTGTNLKYENEHGRCFRWCVTTAMFVFTVRDSRLRKFTVVLCLYAFHCFLFCQFQTLVDRFSFPGGLPAISVDALICRITSTLYPGRVRAILLRQELRFCNATQTVACR